MKKTLLVSALCVLFLSACSIPKIGSKNETETIITPDSSAPTVTPEGAEGSETAPAETPSGNTEDIAATDTPTAIVDGGIYLPYTPTAVAQAKGKIVLFFYASWSPISIATNKNIESNAKDIPSNITILRVNFDDATDLRDAYDVTEQSTFVEVDNTGKLIKKWRGESTLRDIVDKANSTEV